MAGDVSYPDYLALDELLGLQRPRSSPEHPDELLFIVVHQASELWFKVIVQQLHALIRELEGGDCPIRSRGKRRERGEDAIGNIDAPARARVADRDLRAQLIR